MAKLDDEAPAYRSGMRGSERPRRGKLRVMRIEIGDGGASVHHEHEDAKDAKGNRLYGSGTDRTPKIFGDMEGLLAHVKQHLAEAFKK